MRLRRSHVLAVGQGVSDRMRQAVAQFHVDAVAHASDSTSETLPAPKCFKCKKGVVEAVLAQDNAVVWVCPKCRIEGRISNWQGSLWDLRNRPPTSG